MSWNKTAIILVQIQCDLVNGVASYIMPDSTALHSRRPYH